MDIPWSIDARLVHGALRGDKAAFNRLVKRHLATVEAVAYAYTRSHTDAQDVSQEAFFKAYQALDTLKNATKFGSWVTTIARNLGLDRFERHSRELPLSDEIAETLVTFPANHEQLELLEVLYRHVLNMPDETREVLLLHYYAGLSLREVAGTLGITRDAAAKRLQRGRDTLSASVLRALGETKRSPERDRARAKQVTAGAVATLAAWEANASAAATAGIAQATLFAAALKPTVVASLATATAFICFFSYLSYNAPDVKGNAAAPTAQPAPVQTARSSPTFALAQAAQIEKPERPTTGPGSITATVTAGKGQPAEGATVRIELIDWPEFSPPPTETFRKEAVANDAGVAQFTRLPLGLYAIEAQQGPSMWGDYTVLGDKSTHSDSSLSLRSAKPIDGTVIDSEGNPVPGAVVYPHSSPWILNIPWGIFSTLRMVSDENGKIHRDVMPPLPLRYCIVAEGYARTLTGQFTHGNEPLQMVVLRGGSFAGTVVDADTGSPIPRISIEITGNSAVTATPLESGENGEFVSPNLPAGNYHIVLKEEGYTYSSPISVDINEGDQTTGVAVKITMGGAISGYVRDAETGEGVSGATVTASAPGQPTRSSAPTDASGAYVIFGLGNAGYTVAANAAGFFCEGQRDGVTSESGKEVENIDLTVKRGFLVRGLVLESDGRGATTAHIHSVPEGGEGTSSGIATTDGKGGAFELLLPRDADPLWLKAYTLFGSSEIVGPIEVTEEGAVDVTLRASIPRDCVVEGIVVNASGTPIPFIDVWAFFNAEPVYSEVTARQAFTDQSGRFTLSKMHADLYHLRAGYGQGGQIADVPVDIRDGQDERDVVIVFARVTNVAISGHVIDADGKPVPGAEIIVQGPSYGEYTTDAKGEFKIPRTMDGDYHFKVTHTNYSTAYPEPLPEDSNSVTVVMQKRASLEGRVIDNETGKPIEKFELYQHVDGAPFDESAFRAFTGTDGKFKLSRAEAGPSILHVHATGYQTEQVELDLAPASAETGLDIPLRPGGNVTGAVVSSDGEPVADATVFVSDSAGPQPGLAVATDNNGKFAFTGLSVDEITITAVHQAYAQATVRVHPSASDAVDVVITLPATRPLTAIVTLNNAPAPGAYLTAHLRGDDPVADSEAVTDATGRAYLGEFPGGTFRVVAQVRINDSQTWLVRSLDVLSELSAPELDTPIELSIGSGSITGVVTANGVPVPGELIAVHCAGAQLVTYSQDDGSYRIEGVPAGDTPVASGPSLDALAGRGAVHVEDGKTTTLDLAL